MYGIAGSLYAVISSEGLSGAYPFGATTLYGQCRTTPEVLLRHQAPEVQRLPLHTRPSWIFRRGCPCYPPFLLEVGIERVLKSREDEIANDRQELINRVSWTTCGHAPDSRPADPP